MQRVRLALQEWSERRARLREEHQFHLDRTESDFRSLGLSARAAKRAARARFGSRRNLTIALRELGGDLPGLVHLLHGHRVLASVWLQPIVLLTTVLLILLMSPAPRDVLEGVIGKSATWKNRQVIFLSARGRYPWGLTPSEFEALRSMETVTEVERFQGLHARARAMPGVTLEAVQSEARVRIGSRRFWAEALPDRPQMTMGPAQAIWLLMLLYSILALRRHRAQFSRRWLIYGLAVAFLHAFTSLTAWAFANQLWNRSSLTGFSFLTLAFYRVAAIQLRYCWTDLGQRCPVCLDRLLLPVTEGTDHSVLFSPAVTESVCAHGHGVLVESRWSRRFRPQQSPLQALVRA